MIVDFHAHVLDDGWLPQATWEGFMPLYERLVGSEAAQARPLDAALADLWDPGGDRLIDEMDACGIDVSVLLPMDHGYELGEAHVPILEQNAAVEEICARHVGRLVWFFGIDPRRPGAAAHFRRALERGARGLKLYPPAGFYPGDDACEPLYRLAIEAGVPVVAHCGPASAPLRSKYAHPLAWDEVAARFPRLRIVLGHGGKIEAWARDAVAIAIFKPNISLDISLWDGWVPRERLDELLDFMRERIGADRILWATDRFGMGDRDRIAAWRDEIGTLHERTGFSDREVEAVMAGYARRLLHLDDDKKGGRRR